MPSATKTMKHWTNEEIEYLRDHPNESVQALASRFGRSLKAVHAARHRLGVRLVRQWSNEDDQYLRDHPKESLQVVANHLGRSHQAVKARRHRLGLAASHHWSSEDDQYLRDHPNESVQVLAKHLGRSLQAAHSRRCKLGLSGERLWSDQDWAFIQANQHLHAQAMADQLGRSYQALRKQLDSMGIVLPPKPRPVTTSPTVKQIGPTLKTKSGPWSAKEDALLMRNGKKEKPDWLAVARKLGRSYNAVQIRAFRISANKKLPPRMSDTEQNRIRRLAKQGKCMSEIATILGRPRTTIRRTAIRLGLKLASGHRLNATPEQITRLLRTHTMTSVIAKLGVSQPTIRRIAREHGIALRKPGRPKAA